MQTFSDLITQNYLYVDKTKEIYNLFARGGKYYFLSRPRRFGKSLLISTLYEMFSGNRQLFKGLWIHDKIQWEKHPIIHIDFTGIDFETLRLLKSSLNETLERTGNEYSVQLTSTSYKTRFGGEEKGARRKKTGKTNFAFCLHFAKFTSHFVDDVV